MKFLSLVVCQLMASTLSLFSFALLLTAPEWVSRPSMVLQLAVALSLFSIMLMTYRMEKDGNFGALLYGTRAFLLVLAISEPLLLNQISASGAFAFAKFLLLTLLVSMFMLSYGLGKQGNAPKPVKT